MQSLSDYASLYTLARFSRADSYFSLQIFEKSRFASEIGAALVISPNGARVLYRLGFSFSAAKAVELDTWSVLRGNDLQSMTSVDLSSAKERFGAGVWAVHRVDLHNELLRLATTPTEPGHPIQINLASEVVSGTNDGSITLRGGSRHVADLVIAADGLHSALKTVVLGQDATSPSPTGLSAFRFLIDSQKLTESILTPETLQKRSHEATLLADTQEKARERHMMWYACRKSVIDVLLLLIGQHSYADRILVAKHRISLESTQRGMSTETTQRVSQWFCDNAEEARLIQSPI